MNALHDALKAKTKAVHTHLERQSILNNYLSKTLDARTYQAILYQTLQAFAAWQKQADTFFAQTYLDSLFRIDLKHEHLKKDLLNVEVNLPVYGEPLALLMSNKAHYLGCSYVFKGSELGAKIIYKKLCQNNNINTQPMFYFQEVTQNASDNISWAPWMKALENYVVEHHISMNDVTDAAVMCFERLSDWFGIQRVGV
ncbi:MAG: biliverdin-producing heme oxygenase [Legionellaceae bacterium]|nr:biliverdin-producing heme oxygenase [Legionellaceae bacterium]